MTKIISKLLLLSFVLSGLTIKAQTIRLNYEPQGGIIKFCFDSLKIYTDTTALFKLYSKGGDNQDVIGFVRKRFNETGKDTLMFSGHFIPFTKDGKTGWTVNWAIVNLTKRKLVKIYDKHGKLVRKIKKKRIGSRKKGYVAKLYINKETKEKLLSEILYVVFICPSF